MRSSRVSCTVVALWAALLTLQASAQDPAPDAEAASPPPAEESRSVEEVVVRGRRMSEIEVDLRIHVKEFVGEIAASPPGRGYARWHRSVCVGVHNLQQTPAQYIVDRISLLAVEVGLEPGEPGCAPDVFVIFATNGKEVAASLVESQSGIFRPVMGHGHMSLSREALQEFAESDRAVRWWHVSMPVDARTGQPAIRLPQADDPPVVNVAGPSRIHSGIRDDMRRVIIIVDPTKLTGTTWKELGDYLAVVSLVQIDPDADPTSFDSILNLFSNAAAYTGLTDWDRSYVRALYDFDQERRPELQVREVVSKMVERELGSDE
jgi:hypothetical protein